MTVTQSDMDAVDLVMLVNGDGTYRWSSTRSNAECAAVLRNIADDMESAS